MIARVLVVDDEAAIGRSLAATLRRAGFEVTVADDGAPAIRLGATETFDLVVADYQMKTASGIDVVRYYKNRYGAAIYCAVLSGDDNEAMREACLAAGADDVFLKPASPIELRRRLLEVASQLRAA